MMQCYSPLTIMSIAITCTLIDAEEWIIILSVYFALVVVVGGWSQTCYGSTTVSPKECPCWDNCSPSFAPDIPYNPDPHFDGPKKWLALWLWDACMLYIWACVFLLPECSFCKRQYSETHHERRLCIRSPSCKRPLSGNTAFNIAPVQDQPSYKTTFCCILGTGGLARGFTVYDHRPCCILTSDINTNPFYIPMIIMHSKLRQ